MQRTMVARISFHYILRNIYRIFWFLVSFGKKFAPITQNGVLRKKYYLTNCDIINSFFLGMILYNTPLHRVNREWIKCLCGPVWGTMNECFGLNYTCGTIVQTSNFDGPIIFIISAHFFTKSWAPFSEFLLQNLGAQWSKYLVYKISVPFQNFFIEILGPIFRISLQNLGPHF